MTKPISRIVQPSWLVLLFAVTVALRNVSTTLIHPGSTFRLDSVTPAGGLWVDGELAGTEVFALRA
jgi:hypothetical protein